ncbi:hypothetical protein RJ640_004350 [Escallonia rubra]|uniref:Agenet domain-containing protein n=1 Tax=Escallonia rubra TaxID=112253 RepID=A0AA88UHT6_9ASTE|nr:hypothetical protein RJ640_004350 [Escallonia rubra]
MPKGISVGKTVEVTSNEDGFLGSYSEAKVLARVDRDKYEVEYTKLLDDRDANKFLREVVEAALVRPLPPEIRVSGFDVLDKVDAYDNEVWWVGRVTGMDGPNRYSVYFDSSGDEYTYPFHELRVHQEYDDGQWVTTERKAKVYSAL